MCQRIVIINGVILLTAMLCFASVSTCSATDTLGACVQQCICAGILVCLYHGHFELHTFLGVWHCQRRWEALRATMALSCACFEFLFAFSSANHSAMGLKTTHTACCAE